MNYIKNLEDKTFTIKLYLKDREIELTEVEYETLKGFYNIMYYQSYICVVIQNFYIKVDSISMFTVMISGDNETIISIKQLNERFRKTEKE